MHMPERSFGRTVRYRRTKLGLSQTKLAELVGRTTPTVRSWERDKSRPNDPKVLAALAAVLGVDERHLFDKAEVDRPEIETSPTVEQALATLSREEAAVVNAVGVDHETDEGDSPAMPLRVQAETPEPERSSVVVEARDEVRAGDGDVAATDFSDPRETFHPQPIPVVGEEADQEAPTGDRGDNELVGASGNPAYAAPPEPYNQTPLTPTVGDVSYIEDDGQRQLYRVRNLATLVAVVALVIAFIWAIGEGLGALTAWWDNFVGNLRL